LKLRKLPVVSVARGRSMALMLLIPSVYLPVLSARNAWLTPRTDGWYFSEGATDVCGWLFWTLLLGTFFEVMVAIAEGPLSLSRPTDRLMILTVTAAADIHARTRRRLNYFDSHWLCAELERLAYVAERDLTLPFRAPRRVRRELQEEALRIAAVYRAHQKPLALVRRPQDADPLVASLLSAADALAAGDRAALLANAPDHVTRPNVIRRLVSRVWPAIVLIGSGALLPLIPPVARQPDAVTTSLRTFLIITGVLTLLAGTDTANRVASPLDKVLPWR
jgi:hypothetical protein